MKPQQDSTGPRVHVFGEVAMPIYFQPLKMLFEQGRLANYGLHSLRWFRPIAKNILLRAGLVRGRQHEPVSPGELLQRISAFRHLLKSDTVVVMLEPYDARIAMFLPIKAYLQKRGAKLVYYSSWPDWDSDWQPRRALPGMKKLWDEFLADIDAVCVTDAVAKAIGSRSGRNVVIPHPVDTQRFFPAARPKKTAQDFRWVSVARLVHGKGLHALIELFKKHSTKLGQLSIIGDGPLAEELRDLARDSRVTILPFDKDKLPDQLRAHDGFVLNSHRHGAWEELFGMVLIEAMACGLPVVSTDCIGPKSFLHHGQDALLTAQQESQALAAALQKIEQDKSLRDQLARNGLSLVKEKYDLRVVAEQWFDVLAAN